MTIEEVRKLEVGDLVVYDTGSCVIRRIGKIIKINGSELHNFRNFKISWCETWKGEDPFGVWYSDNDYIWNFTNCETDNREIIKCYRKLIKEKIKDIKKKFDEYKKWTSFENI